MGLSWVEAVREHAKRTGKKFSIPKKGTAEYDAVKALMGAPEKKEADKVKIPRKSQMDKVVSEKKAEVVKKDGIAVKKVEEESVSSVEEVKPKRVRNPKAPAAKQRKRVKTEKKPRVAKVIPEGATKMAVMDSKNPGAVLENATNEHLPIVAPEVALSIKAPKQKAQKKVLVEKPALPSLADPEKPVSDAPFSFQALRNQLGC